MGHNSPVSSHSISTSFPQVDGWSTDPRVLGHHNVYYGTPSIIVKNIVIIF